MSMKKKILAAVMFSTVILSSPLQSANVFADSTDDQISAQDGVIANAQAGAADAKAQQDSLQKEVDTTQKKLTDLASESQKTTDQIKSLSQSIEQRKGSLAAQARSAQVNGGGTNVINILLDSKNLSDMVQKVSAMTKIVSANSQMVKQQQDDQKAMETKLKANTDAFEQATQLTASLSQKQADLQVAQLNYQATIATAQDQKDSLLAQKAAAEASAKELAKAWAAAPAASSTAPAASSSSAPASNGNASASSASSASTGGSSASSSSTAPSYSYASGGNSSYDSGSYGSTPNGTGNPYPYGQCTWGVWQYVHDNFGISLPGRLGNGADWAYSLPGTSAHVGAVAVFGPAADNWGFGHVAVVTAVGDGTVTIIETNYLGSPAYHTRTIPTSSVMAFASAGV